ncbi:MAG: Aurachin B dehydrogenase [Myxococcota bacterium]|nr:Aurachin B dehydrogenase [Myxococcota bacterium]
MKILLTGATGFLGSHVAEQLSGQGHVVRCVVRKSSNRKFLDSLRNIEYAEGPVENEAAMAEAVKGVDAVIHSAGLVKARTPAGFREVNVGGTAVLLEAAVQHNPGLKRFVLVSSLAAIGPSLDGKPLTEEADKAPKPVTHYGRSKLEAEIKAREYASRLPVTIVRPPLIYGPRDQECWAFFDSIRKGVLPMLDGGQNTLSVIYGADAAAALIRAAEADVPSGSAYFIEDGEVRVWKDMLETLEKSMGQRAWLRISMPLWVMGIGAFFTETYGRITGKAVMLTRDKLNELAQPHWVCDSTKARRELGWAPQVDWETGTRLTWEWYKKEGWL